MYSEDAIREDLYPVMQHLQQKGWFIALHKIKGPATSVKFLGIIWRAEGKKIPLYWYPYCSSL